MNLLLDIDGTLWDTREDVAASFNSFFAREGLGHVRTDSRQLTALFGKDTRAIADVLLSSVPAPARYPIMERCMEAELAYLATCSNPGYPGVREALEEAAKAHRLYIVSNCSAGYPELCMEQLGIRPFISGHLCYGQTHTPKGETIRILMTREGMDAAVYIGDTQGDLDAARAAGIPFVWAAYGLGEPRQWEAKISDISQLNQLDFTEILKNHHGKEAAT